MTTPERNTDVQPDTLVKAAEHLRVIERLARRADTGQSDVLLTQAVHLAGDALMPGGLAMVALAKVANQESYGHKLETAEQMATAQALRLGLAPSELLPEIEDDDSWEPPLQTLCFWSEQWRVELKQEYEDARPPTVRSEANFIRSALEWAFDNEIHWRDFVRDLAKVRGRLESLLLEGIRPSMRGVPCLYDECRGARLIRTTVAKSRKDLATGEQVKAWVLTDWHCPECNRTWTEDEYQRNVYAALHRAKTVLIEEIDPEAEDGYVYQVWCTLDQAAKRVNRPESTLRVWIHRGDLTSACVISGRRVGFVRLSDVEARHELAVRRAAKRKQTTAAKRTSDV